MNGIQTQHRWLVVVLAGVLVMSGTAAIHAATIGYWRFESSDDFLKDSGPNGFNLGTVGAPAPTYLALPVSGPGSKFSNPILQTEQSNAGVADFGSAPGGYFSTAGTSDIFNVNAFTIEAFVNLSNRTDTDILIASQNGGTDRSWQFGVNRVAGTNDYGLSLYCAPNASHDPSARFFLTHTISGFPRLVIGNDYYVAASFDLSAQTGGVKLYLQDLTAGADLHMATFNHDLSVLNHSDADFCIGSRATGQYIWSGLIDEVRFSNTVLSEGQLLIQVPEPATIFLVVGALLCLAFRRRR